MNSITGNTTTADLLSIGTIKLSEMGTLPFVAPYYKGKEIPRHSKDMCKDYDGDCFKFVSQYLKI